MHFMNVGHTCVNAARLVHAVTGEPPGADTLHEAYRAAISAPWMRPFPAEREGVSIVHDVEPWASHCRGRGIFEEIFAGAGAGPVGAATRAHRDSRMAAALDLVQDISPDLRLMVELLVTDVLLVDTDEAGGGSHSSIPGLVVLSPGADWDTGDYAMSLVHEFMHLNLFLADSVYGVFTLSSDELEDERYLALSAVKGRRRPLDRAFHAAVVTVPVILMRHRLGMSPFDASGPEEFQRACADLQRHEGVFSDYGRLLLGELTAFSRNLDVAHAGRCVSDPRYAAYPPVPFTHGAIPQERLL
ncbi:aKG-HExxH-type peptide beta-hydroxylase [Streptomyces sp. NPDC048297]|uniref:aKG-HExxH-type peptide beta-hydroxylase n=1 Tax=Streptomyces sp. NPDC048297 TaxID=3365531 RepID=UPI003710BC30